MVTLSLLNRCLVFSPKNLSKPVSISKVLRGFGWKGHISLARRAKIINRSLRTLRAWDRQSRLVPKRLPSGHRYYTDADIEVALHIEKKESRKLNVVYCRVSRHA